MVAPMNSDPDGETLADLYEELSEFAPSKTADEMAALAARLTELREQSDGEVAPSEVRDVPGLDGIWARVESYLDSADSAETTE